jgi:hypothetical protein
MKEGFRQNSEVRSYFLPHSQAELKMGCIQRRYISNLMQLVPGLGMANELGSGSVESIWGTYGLVQLDAQTKNSVVRSGFSVIDNRILEITHTPQGNRPENMINGERRRLRSREFRVEMIGEMIRLARQLSLHQVRSLYSGDHHSIRTGFVDELDSYVVMDKPFDQYPGTPFQFVEVSDENTTKGYWVFNL